MLSSLPSIPFQPDTIEEEQMFERLNSLTFDKCQLRQSWVLLSYEKGSARTLSQNIRPKVTTWMERGTFEIDFTWSMANASTLRFPILLATWMKLNCVFFHRFHSALAVNQYILLVFCQLSDLISFAYSFVWIITHHRIWIKLILSGAHTKDANDQ